MRKIVYYPDPVLRVVTPPIGEVDAELEQDIDALVEVMQQEKEHAAGLAAPQIGLKRRFFGLIMGEKRKLEVFINPEIVKTYQEKTRPVMVYENGEKDLFLEGCLSFPGLFGTVRRYLKIEARWMVVTDGKLVSCSRILEGMEAIAFQHELDHLNGVLFIDRIKEEKGELYQWEGEKKKRVEVDSWINQEKSNY